MEILPVFPNNHLKNRYGCFAWLKYISLRSIVFISGSAQVPIVYLKYLLPNRWKDLNLKLWSTYWRLIVAGVNSQCSNGSFRHWQVSGLATSSVAAFFIAVHCRFCFISAIEEPSQPHPGWFLGFTSALPQFWTITFSCQSIPHHPPNVNIPDTTSHVQPANFFYLIWWELLWAATSATHKLWLVSAIKSLKLIIA